MGTSTVTVCRGDGNWEVLYVDGQKEYANHLDRSWPHTFLEKIEGKTVTATRVIGDEQIREHVDEDDTELAMAPDGDEIWQYPDVLPDELQAQKE